MATMSSLGIGSGIDTAGMLDQIKAGEQTRLQPYAIMQASYKAKLSAWGQISSAMSALQSSVKALSGDAFNTLKVSSNKAFNATATTDATADSHSVTVNQLAAAHKLKTQGFDSSDKALGDTTRGTRTVTITTGDGKTTSVELADDQTSLDQIAKAINKQDGDVTASVQRTDDGYQLVLSSKSTGSAGEMSVSVTGDDKLGSILNTSHGGNTDVGGANDNGDAMLQVTAAQDAKLTVDGSQYTRSSNNISDIISGVTLNLQSVSELDDDGKPKSEELTLTPDTSVIKTDIKDFVDKYNALLSLTTSASKYVPNDNSGLQDDQMSLQSNQNGALMGDSMLRSMVGEFRAAVNGSYNGGEGDFSALADIGIKIDAATGKMTLDESKLDEAIADNPESIADLFTGTGENDGVATSLKDIINKYVGEPDTHTDGLIKSTTDGLDDQVELMDDQIARTQRLIDADVERYRVQFQNLDGTMSTLNNLSSQLSSILASV
ncbi:flagellar filament capping protein FliD [Pantoea sp.]|uniref:flagellar filament capping protein FliD n=1 Tax=Pantoea sp. TaxID=69393 RepID=UPI0028A0FFDD|nr:flagellar filament capping protein FliD [Pantoea sp.]